MPIAAGRTSAPAVGAHGDFAQSARCAARHAAHSIKGGSATFGFRDLVEVTHELETLLDKLRKQAQGTLTLSASHQGGNIVIEAGDDGAGLNRDRILAKAKQRGLEASDNMPDQRVWQLIFEPGFSTADVVTDVSGRGVPVVVESEGGKTVLMVDKLLGQQQVVVKNLEVNYRKAPGVSGATVMGDGTVARDSRHPRAGAQGAALNH